MKTFARHPFEHEDFKVSGLEYLLDYLLINNSLSCQNIEIPDTTGSDHLPLIATLSLTP